MKALLTILLITAAGIIWRKWQDFVTDLETAIRAIGKTG